MSNYTENIRPVLITEASKRVMDRIFGSKKKSDIPKQIVIEASIYNIAVKLGESIAEAVKASEGNEHASDFANGIIEGLAKGFGF